MPKKKDPLIRVRIIALLEEPHMHSPVVILHDPKSDRVLPIWIGEPEARAIAMVLQKVSPERPLTHTLMKGVIRELGGKVDKVVIDEIEGGTYFATIYIKKGSRALKVDARPSDSIAMALECDASIYIAQSVLDVAGQENPFPPEKIEEMEKMKKKEFRARPQADTDLSEKEVDELKDLLKKARERERGEN